MKESLLSVESYLKAYTAILSAHLAPSVSYAIFTPITASVYIQAVALTLHRL